MEGVFVLAIILLMHGKEDNAILPVLVYPSEEICKQKITELEKDFVFKNPNLDMDCYPWDKFSKKEEDKKDDNNKPK